ncbi:uracil-DNA glycosylase [Metamycoplasma alkalescens]|uniref:uracil-DNA glycosylase n=1 Tax=Metamycoplasma alkalescens TaxID=45363 RepID=A0A318U8X3_9BACT|nr:uracil-DNA glycosylase [Metamycoplasma alkalescens]PYF42565.1 uracil-DNA glycosylase [Metamycoplasma alkalescens]
MKFNFEKFLARQKLLPYWKKIEEILQSKNLIPNRNLIFEAFNNFDFDNLKLVIVGQDPYPTNNNADGLCFSSKNKQTPKSLQNIFIEIKNSYPNATFLSNSLLSWKNQGILLLNSILTTEAYKPLAHKNIGWEIFNINLLNELLSINKEILFLAMGKNAQDFVQQLKTKKENFFFTAHPSPLSCHKGFFHSQVFKKINEKLLKLNKKPIIWDTK